MLGEGRGSLPSPRKAGSSPLRGEQETVTNDMNKRRKEKLKYFEGKIDNIGEILNTNI
jgi:hypothetical protein